MKEKVVNKSMNLLNEYYTYDDKQLKKIKYGFEGIYITMTKFLVTILISLILNSFRETIIFLLIFTPLRNFGFGIHASKSVYCWFTTIPMFCGIPILSKILIINSKLIVILAAISVISLIIFAPADTKKRPLKSKKKRIIYKIILSLVSISYLIYIVLTNNIYSKMMMFALIIETILTNPITYKIFGQPYGNYKLSK